MSETSTRRVLVRGKEQTVTLKRRDVDEKRHLKRKAREAARAEARKQLAEREQPAKPAPEKPSSK